MKYAIQIGAILSLVVIVPLAGAEEKRVSRSAAAVIKRVREAAERQDFGSLRKLMVQDFTWSFGGDRDADQAIEAWKDDPAYLRELVSVLREGCHVDTTRYGTEANVVRVKCPGAGGEKFRAGFIQIKDGWRMEYFVAGD